MRRIALIAAALILVAMVATPALAGTRLLPGEYILMQGDLPGHVTVVEDGGDHYLLDGAARYDFVPDPQNPEEGVYESEFGFAFDFVNTDPRVPDAGDYTHSNPSIGLSTTGTYRRAGSTR